MEEYEKVKNWLVSSGLCILNKTDPNAGAVHSYYDTKDHKYSFLYPEITGYNLSTLKFLYSKEKSSEYIDIAKLCGSWLMSIRDKYGGIVMGIGPESRMTDQIFSFDTSICAKGFLDLYEMTGDGKYKDFARNLIDWLVAECIEENGTVKPVMDRKSGKFVETSMWYAQKGCFGIKLIMPLLQYGDLKLKEVAVTIANTYKKFQNADGSFALHLGSKSVNLHSHSYALEGLIYAYAKLKDPAYLESCRNGLDWVISQMNADGSVYLWTNFNYKSKAAYPIAQLIRLMALVDSVDNTSKYLQSAKRLTDFLLTLQAKDEDSQMNGGFYEEFHKSIMGWKKQHRINSWTSMFALQALDWIENHDKLQFEKSVEYLY